MFHLIATIMFIWLMSSVAAACIWSAVVTVIKRSAR